MMINVGCQLVTNSPAKWGAEVHVHQLHLIVSDLNYYTQGICTAHVH